METKLTDKQRIFCERYLIHFNATKAAIEAGYSEKTAKVMGYENLTKPYIQDYLNHHRQKATDDNIIEMNEVKSFLAGVVRASIKDYMEGGNFGLILKDFDDIPDDKMTYLKKASFTKGQGSFVEIQDKMKAAEMLIKMMGGFEADNKQKAPESPFMNLPLPDKVKILSKHFGADDPGEA